MSVNTNIIPIYKPVALDGLQKTDRAYEQLLNLKLNKNKELKLSQHNKFYTTQTGAKSIFGRAVQKIVNIFIQIRHEGLGFQPSKKDPVNLSSRLIEVFTNKAMHALGCDITLRGEGRKGTQLTEVIESFNKIAGELTDSNKSTINAQVKKFESVNEEVQTLTKNTQELPEYIDSEIVQKIINNKFE